VVHAKFPNLGPSLEHAYIYMYYSMYMEMSRAVHCLATMKVSDMSYNTATRKTLEPFLCTTYSRGVSSSDSSS
jgi:hypothetical protein